MNQLTDIAKWLVEYGYPFLLKPDLSRCPPELIFYIAREWWKKAGEGRLDNYIYDVLAALETPEPYLMPDEGASEYEVVMIRGTSIIGVVRNRDDRYALVGIDTEEDEVDILIPIKELVAIDNLIITRAING